MAVGRQHTDGAGNPHWRLAANLINRLGRKKAETGARPILARSHRPLPMRLAHRVGRLFDRFGRRTEFDAESILTRARLQTGVDTWEDTGFRDALERLTTSFDRDADLTPLGRFLVARWLTHHAANRLRLQRYVAAHPAVTDERIENPVFVVGLPRTGTTFLYDLLATDSESRAVVGYETFWPVPPPFAEKEGAEDPRPRWARTIVRALDLVTPQLRDAHAMTAEGPDETTLLLGNSFVAWSFALFGRVKSYDDWLWSAQAPVRESYRYLRYQLQALQHQRTARRWVLKSPMHLPSVDTLLEEFPDATIVQTHRDPVSAVPSTCSLFALLRGVFSDRVDPVEVGEEIGNRLTVAVSRMRAARERHPRGFVDVDYARLTADPVGAVSDLYRDLGETLDDRHERKLQERVGPRPHRSRHRYDAATFGLERFDFASIDTRSPR